MKKYTSIFLIVIGLLLGVLGFNKMSDSGASVEIADIELSAEDSGAKTQSYLMIGGGILCLILGATTMKNKR